MAYSQEETEMRNRRTRAKNSNNVKKKPSGAEIKKKITNYVSKKQGLMGEAARAIKKRQQTLKTILEEMDK